MKSRWCIEIISTTAIVLVSRHPAKSSSFANRDRGHIRSRTLGAFTSVANTWIGQIHTVMSGETLERPSRKGMTKAARTRSGPVDGLRSACQSTDSLTRSRCRGVQMLTSTIARASQGFSFRISEQRMEASLQCCSLFGSGRVSRWCERNSLPPTKLPRPQTRLN